MNGLIIALIVIISIDILFHILKILVTRKFFKHVEIAKQESNERIKNIMNELNQGYAKQIIENAKEYYKNDKTGI